MTISFNPGLVHSPVTPFTNDHRIDYDLYGRLLDFHLTHGADSLALPLHIGESVSLTDDERIALIRFAVDRVAGKVPVIAHVSQSGTAMAAALARRAEEAGAAAIVATTPYYWTPPPAMLFEHFTQIGRAVRIPFYVLNSPHEMGTKVSTDVTVKLLDALPNFVGLVDASLDWQFMIDVVSTARKRNPNFQLVSGLEYLIPAYAIGARGAVTPLGGLAPRAARRLYELCSKERFSEALPLQEDFAVFHQLFKHETIAATKEAIRLMGRNGGAARSPVRRLDPAQISALEAGITAFEFMKEEPRGW